MQENKVKDITTSVAGLIGAVAVSSDIDWNKLAAGDKTERAKGIGTLVMLIFGFFIGRRKPKKTEDADTHRT